MKPSCSSDGAEREVSADWLDERGDFRAGLICLEEETRALSRLDDTHWRHQAQLAELRAAPVTDFALSFVLANLAETRVHFPTNVPTDAPLWGQLDAWPACMTRVDSLVI